MGANARRRYGRKDKGPKIGTPFLERTRREVYTNKGMHLSNRQLKKLEGYEQIVNPIPTTE